MKKNIGTTDGVIRILLVVVIAILLLTRQIEGIVGIGLAILAIMLLGTSILKTCPLYLPFNISSRKDVRAGN